ncbi:acetyl-CoA carboxylase, carboxyltransferase subunit beta [Pseudonocardia sp. RS010]|uniref:acetyl-CoA carboxylase, carboxyltransferase subunit beta n=1 Tax=Pseudonocardia sp. RS010 TaxID=3385979 RepID=UPI0039A09ED1
MTETLPAPPIPRPETPRSVDWVLCRSCDAMVYANRLQRAAAVCPECGHHSPLTAPERLVQLLDVGSAEALSVDVPDADVSDILAFVDSQPYPDRLRDARRRTGLDEAVLCARGRIAGHPVVVAAMDFRFLGGSLGAAVGEAITRACEVAEAERTPLLLVSASGGARMQEGILALMQMAKTSQALRRLDEAGVLTISLITDPTYGGVAASFATLCDVIVAEPGARLGFAGPRVIAQTIGETLPAGFQTAEYLLEHGIIDLIAPRAELRGALAKLLAVGGGAAEVTDEPASVLVRDAAQLPERHPWEAVRAARRFGRPTTLDYANLLLEDFTELHGDRMAADCSAMITGLGRLDGMPVVLVGTQKGRTPAELPKRNYGMPTPAGYRKAARAMRLAGKLGLPVVSLVDTSGAFPGVAAEEQGQAVAIAENLRLLSGLPVPVVAVVTGEGGSGGALALAVADEVLMCGDAVYSVITPEGCASILWKDAGAAPRAAEALRVDARSLLDLGVVDGVVPEAEHGDHLAAAENLGSALVGSLLPLSRMDRATRLARRHERFRRYGAPHIGETA